MYYVSLWYYDFCFEMDGVLKSWVVLKGFLFCVGDKWLVVEVEDYLLFYVVFEGDIFEGYYGVGYVEVFDYGIWVCEGDLL